MPQYALLRGFKVPIPVLDAFLVANGLDETYGTPPMDYKDPASDFLREKTGIPKIRLIIPARMHFSSADFGYIAYDWVMTFAQREIELDKELLDQAPAGFAELRNEIIGFAKEAGVSAQPGGLTSLFTTVTDERAYDAQEVIDREEVSIYPSIPQEPWVMKQKKC